MKLSRRLRLAHGQLAGVLQMYESGRDIEEICVQLQAIQGSIKGIYARLLIERGNQVLREKDLASRDRQDQLKRIIRLLYHAEIKGLSP